MAYIFGLLIVVIFFSVMHFFTELKAKEKVIATVVVLSFVMGAVFYNALQSAEAEHLRDVMLRYKQGKSLECGTLKVSNKDFTLSIGTQTFLGRKNSKFIGQMVAAKECQ